MNSPKLSVILCTYNRASLLTKALESLMDQTLDQDAFEVVLIDDGSEDETRGVVESFSDRLPLRYFYQENSGIASAKNHGACAAWGKILFFFDDDDIATPTLLEEHLKTHEKYPENNYAVLNYTGWSPDLQVTPLMEFVTEIGFFLFYYPSLKDGDIVDYTYFWGGRSSCKKQLLMEQGLFNPVFRFGCEDIELGYRLSRYGFRVVYNANAVSLMARPLELDGFCKRLIRQGNSQSVFASIHDVPEVRIWTEIEGVRQKWEQIKPIVEAKIRSARELDRLANQRLKWGLAMDEDTIRLLYRAYWWACRVCKIKGIAEAVPEHV